MLDILGFIFYAGASLVILFIAAFSGGISRLIAVPAALGYILLAFWLIEQASSDIMRKDKKRDEKVILLLNIASFGFGATSFYLYMHSVVTPILLLGPAFVIGLWRSWKG
ncbi:MAG: hypothetical protein ACTSRP_28450 [Candidatus Helarchaeota archaeon]